MAADLGRREVRAGRSLDALLSAYRTGARVAWRRLAALGLEAGLAPETLVLLAEAIFAYVDELSAESAEGFAREQAERAGELERRRRALAELLVATPAPDAGAVAAAADAAHWRLPATVVVAVWREPPPVLPADALHARSKGWAVACSAGPARELLSASTAAPRASARPCRSPRRRGRSGSRARRSRWPRSAASRRRWPSTRTASTCSRGRSRRWSPRSPPTASRPWPRRR